MESLQSLKASIVKRDWQTAEVVADKLLIETDVSTTIYIQVCYAQAMISAKIGENMDGLVDPDRAKCEAVDMTPQDLRNAVSFLMEGLNVAVINKLKDLIFMGVSCFLRLTQDLYLNGQLRFMFVIPLSIVEQGLALFPNERNEFLIRARLMLAELLVDFLDVKKASTKATDIAPWPTAEEHAEFVSTGSDKTVSILEALTKFIGSRPKDYNLPFNIIKAYLKLLRINPAAKSAKIDSILQNDTLLKTYSGIHGATNTEMSDMKTLFAAVDEKIKNNENSKQVLSFLLDLAEHSLKTGSTGLSKQALEKSALIHVNSNLNIRRELVQLQLELKENTEKKTQSAKSIESNVLKLNHAICTAVDESSEPAVIHSSCMAVWSVIAPTEETNALVRPFSVALKTICDISEKYISMFDTTQRCNFEYKLARCYEFQSIFSLATTHAEKALKFCTQPDVANDIEILLHKLWIKANTFDGHLTPDLKVSPFEALSLADQAKYIPEDNVAFKLLQKSIKTLILDHDLISPPNVIEKDDLVLSLLKNDYVINFDVINANDIKNRRTILVALSDIMRQARELAQKQGKSSSNERLKYWKAVWDASKYLMTLEIEKLVDSVSAQKLKAEALLYQGEALFTFETIKPFVNGSGSKEHQADTLKAIHQAVIEPMIQSLNIGIALKDSTSIQCAASNIWDYFSTTKSGLSNSTLGFWTETFQRLHDGLMECQLQNTNLMVCVCIGYATVLKETAEQAALAAAADAAAAMAATNTVEKTSPAKGGKAPQGEVKPEKDKKTSKQAPQQTNNNAKILEDIVNLGLSASAGKYETKLVLFDLKTSMKTGAPICISNIEGDPTMKIFTCLEVLESKKGNKEELEDTVRNMFLYGSKLGKSLNFELWLRVIQHAYKAEHLHLAYMAIQALFDSCTEGKVFSAANIDIKPTFLFHGKLLYGQIIISLIDKEFLFDSRSAMRATALQKIANALEIVSVMNPIQISQLQTSLEIFSQAACAGIPQKSYLSHIERVLGTLYSCFFGKVPVQNLVSTNQKAQEAILNLTETCLNIYKDKCDWVASTRLIDRTFRLLPKSFHRTLLKAKVQTLSLGNKSGISALLKDWDVDIQFEM
ncbi:UNVERIFIED_CONTAM: hypothetical protein HDU68_008751 [Siphonaria sp. JEL0065]|nr:hypothetical protein HDU68_008751 [Siphonaria sp. JEL0065]